ncbi:MAG: hypothetical protein GX752_02585 [Clostridium sp.]|nr:hypothetical protein [Clostridium sp.]
MFFCCIFLLSCSAVKTEKTDNNGDPINKAKLENSKIDKEEIKTDPEKKSNNLDSKNDYKPDLSTEDGIKNYLIGEWIFDKEYISDVVCKMIIDDELKVSLSFHDSYKDEAIGDYSGKVSFERAHVKENEAPDLVSIELTDADYTGGKFFFLHRTIYDGKVVMSWFFEDYGDTVFNFLGYDEFQYAPEEIMFEKEVEFKSDLSPRKNSEFYAVFWGKGADKQSMWIDEVNWTPRGYDEYEIIYSERMTFYENDLPESTLYKVADKSISDILGDDLFPGDVYFVETDNKGNIIEFINPEYKEYLESSFEDYSKSEFNDYDESEIYDLIFEIIENEVEETKEYLNLGMEVLIEDEHVSLDGNDCYQIALGTNHEDYFVREIFYGVNVFTRQVYRYDPFTDIWNEL